jgi:GntR family transcriptional repressor for pyruvate dehydrogenase complex
MPQYQRIKQPKLADIVAEQIEAMILEGTLKPGERLPAERELAARFSVSRPSLREAIGKLEARGLLFSRQGGGTFITDELSRAFADPLNDILSRHPESQFDLLEFRHALEGVSAYYAAVRSTEADREVIKRHYEILIEMHDDEDSVAEARADAAVQLSTAEAAHNVVLLQVMRGLFSLLEKSIVSSFETLYTRDRVRDKIPEQHKVLLDAIMRGDGDGARNAAHDHLAFVEETLLELDREKSRQERSLRRLRHLSE